MDRTNQSSGRYLAYGGPFGTGFDCGHGTSAVTSHSPRTAEPVRLRRSIAARPTATMTAAPLKTSVIHESTPSSVKPLTAVATKNSATIVPGTLYTPGNSVVAPKNTAASAGSRN